MLKTHYNVHDTPEGFVKSVHLQLFFMSLSEERVSSEIEDLKSKLVIKTDELNEAFKTISEVCMHARDYTKIISLYIKLNSQNVNNNRQLKNDSDKINELETQWVFKPNNCSFDSLIFIESEV